MGRALVARHLQRTSTRPTLPLVDLDVPLPVLLEGLQLRLPAHPLGLGHRLLRYVHGVRKACARCAHGTRIA